MARYLRYQDLKPLKGITFSRQHIGRLQKALKFPLSVSFGDNTEVFSNTRSTSGSLTALPSAMPKRRRWQHNTTLA